MAAAHLIHRNIVLQPKKEGMRMISESDERMRKIAQKRINNKYTNNQQLIITVLDTYKEADGAFKALFLFSGCGARG